jgi:hypothetical protein
LKEGHGGVLLGIIKKELAVYSSPVRHDVIGQVNVGALPEAELGVGLTVTYDEIVKVRRSRVHVRLRRGDRIIVT